ncbi:MAG: CBS domain-containing protein [Gemmatimonadetes bacterium]|nr:CBS domain-containing protein [Gemmatimonadota bacterium]
MKVRELMTDGPRVCAAWADVGHASHQLWDGDCGSLPVIDESDRVVGMITDRDICMALASRDESASEVPVSQVMTRNVVSCHPEDDLNDALHAMRQGRIRRLPVVDEKETIVGILSLSDVIREARAKAGSKGPTYGDVVDTLKAIRGEPVPAETTTT